MVTGKIYSLIKKISLPSRWLRGLKYFDKQLIDSVDVRIHENYLEFQSVVESEYNNEVYPNTLYIDFEDNELDNAYCTCQDFKSNYKTDNNFLCKHLVATALKGIDKVESEEYLNKGFSDAIIASHISKTVVSTPDKKLLHYFKNASKEQVNLDVEINIIPGRMYAEFKIGLDRMYIIKSIKEFANARVNNKKLEYGVNFTYDPNSQYFTEKDEKIVEVLEGYGNNLPSYSLSSNTKKYLELNVSSLKPFMELLTEKDFSLVYAKNKYRPKIIAGPLPIEFEFIKTNDGVSLTAQDSLPIPITKKNDIILYQGDIYILNNDDSNYYGQLYETLNENNTVEFQREDVKDVLNFMLPKIKSITDNVYLDKEIEDNIITSFKTELYFDIKGSQVTCDLKFVYADADDEDKFIVPDIEKENQIKLELLGYNFIEKSNAFLFAGTDEDLFEFLDVELEELKNLGDIYYSDKFKGNKIYKSGSIKAFIDEKIGSYIDFSFNIADIDFNEYDDIMTAFKESRTFYKLKDGSFMDLREDKTKDFLDFIENLGFEGKETSYRIPNNKALYMDEYIKDKGLDFIEGKEIVENICSGFKNIDNLDFTIPEELKADLRSYQESGFNWFKVLDNYNFGGILADEMGLGKTLQTIAFLLAQKNKKSIVVTPTSVIYNWKSEFEKFAPTLNVQIVHGDKNDRKNLIEDYDKYDIIITTYGTFKNDIELYQDINFDYCIIDEAQNIKNPTAQVTKAIKSVNANCRFALTGTPIENNLVELWSIFDFIMPGYLFNKKKFQNVYLKKEANLQNLKLLIKPFMLRRTKKQVMTELPDKIEKNYFVELNKDERNIYSSYAKEVQKKLMGRDLKNDKIVIFSYLTRLRQLCLDPSIVVEGYNHPSSKVNTCIRIVEESIENDHKVLLFSQFTTVLKKLASELDKNKVNYSYIDGSTKAKDRLDLVDEFNGEKEKRVFLISLKAGGIGLNLTSADTVIHFDPWWNPSVEDQATDRAHRFGQKNTVQVIKLIAKGTIEEKILKLQENKKDLISQFVNGSLANENILKNLTDKEIVDLFS
ncbi:DEAD/DEAH box helicase [Metaclostridioides mangenotii]|uniref:DEAD/DEAH box helicase n=1 Tax=Metaclostridioides mangenotii TaxID=1540 RepID=UPI0026E928D6|nr:DEAD/DEAH box helicase [Clostridioides mangenotii]